MLKVKNGDIPAFEQIMKKHEKPVINTIYRFVGNRIRAEEIAQEVFIKVYNSAKRYRPKAKFSTWLYKIVTNTCFDDLRKKKNISASFFENEIPDPKQSSQDIILEKDESDCFVREAINSLPKRQRIAVILREYNGLSYREISKILRCSTKSVESLLYHAKLGLKEKLMPYLKEGKI
ncbi:MAG: sigma-70 family RNA polymerase sigma factor [Candidatus Aminicenantes bacterium]|nr:sigma-70 family RNA polymerase sigma factor [Candidatus Aminicenantes bacterium]